ncbi:MAG: GNAT family N-acetyltransferase [Bacteroidota bacterium]
MEINWLYKSFTELSPFELYEVLKLRNEVFVLEQNCVYQDADGKDKDSWHLMGWDQTSLVAYCRIIPPGNAFDEASIGRVVSSPLYRRTGSGRQLMKIAIEKTLSQFNCQSVRIGAQLYLKDFYTSLGFEQASEIYLEDGIKHIEMIVKKG